MSNTVALILPSTQEYSVLRWGDGMENLYVQISLSLWKSSLNGLASSHVLRLTLSGAPIILLYCTEYKRPTTLAPTNEAIMGSMRKKPYRRKITLYWVKWSVRVVSFWVLTTMHKSLKRVETCQKNHFIFQLFAMLTHSLDLIFQMVFTLWMYVYISVLFRIEPLIFHSSLNDVVLI
jgi:hypothetical protein